MASASRTLFCSVSHFLFLLLSLSIIMAIQSSHTCPLKSFYFSCSDIHNQEFPINHFTNTSLRDYSCGGPCELTCDNANHTRIKCSDDEEEPPYRVLEINATSLTITIAVDGPHKWLCNPCKVYSHLNFTFPLFKSVSLFITGLPGRNGTFIGCSNHKEDEKRDYHFSHHCGQKDAVVHGPFYDHAPMSGCMKFVMDFSLLEKPAMATGPSPNDTGNLRKIILSVFLVIVITTAALVIIITYLRRRNGKPSLRPLPSSIMSLIHTRSDLEEGSTNNGVTVFPYAELEEVTNNFDPARELGEGGFGVVYHGKLNDGREVAVKRMFEKNYRQIEQFKNEIQLLTNVRHPNLVTLYGSTSRHSRELLLVYEYIPNGTLSDHLHGRQSKSALLLWPTRLNIAIQTASALCYLHYKDIIHRDIKSNNILLDKTFVAKVADFGLSRLFPSDVSHVSTAPQGTPGYLDPEYHQCYHLTDRSDVYSFGVVLVELISSREAVDFGREGHEVNLANYAMNRIQGCEFGELVDVNLGYDKSFKVRRMTNLVAELAFRCLQHEREIRPSMEEVLEELKRIESVDYEDLEAEEMA